MLQRFCSIPPDSQTTGDIESMDLVVGQSAGLVHEMKSVAAIVHELTEAAREIIASLSRCLTQP